jgi:hypothetical protein
MTCSTANASVTVLPKPSSFPDAASPLWLDEYNSDYDYNSELDASETPSQFHLPAKDLASGIQVSPSHHQQLHRRRMTAQLARQKVSDLSYEIGVLKKLQERLERRRERFLFYCMTQNK